MSMQANRGLRSRAFPKCRLSMNAETYADAPGIPFFSVELFIQLQAIAGFRNSMKNAQSRKYSERFRITDVDVM